MAEKILVVGATSKVGAELVDALLSGGETVRAATRHPDELKSSPEVETIQFDYSVHGTMKPALQDVDRVFMLSPWTDPHPEMTANRFVDHAIVENVKHLTYLSVLGIDKQPSVGLPMVEKHIAKSGMGYTILRPNWLMQNFSRGFFQRPISDISTIVAPGGQAAVSFVDARDVAAVAAASLADPDSHAGSTYTLTGGQSLSYGDVAGTLEAVTGRRIAYQDSSPESFRDTLMNYWSPDESDYLLELMAHSRSGDAEPVDQTLKTLLGRAPTSFEQFARDHEAIWR